MFKKRTSKPGTGNKCYITRGNGGWSWCIQGSPTDSKCNVLSNCVGYSCGRFNEIYNEIKGTTGMKYYALNCNAENFIERAKSIGLEVVDYPVLGGIMVWQKGSTLSGNDGAGHVETVEEIYDSNNIYTSASNYGGTAFYNAKRSNSNGRWGLSSGYSFRGCIVNPAIGKVGPDAPTPKPGPVGRFNIGDKVYIKGALYTSSNDNNPAGYTEEKVTNITRVNPGSAHPYNTTGDLGWMDEASIRAYVEPKPEPTPAPSTEIKVGDFVTVTGAGNAASTGTSRSWTRKYFEQRMKVIMIAEGRPYPYACNQYGEGVVGRASDVTGWFSASSVKK